MPLLDADDVTMATEMDGDFRPRAGSNSSTGSGVFRGIFRKKQKSGDNEGSRGSSRGTSPQNTPGATGNKMKNFLESIRPRSKSDAQHKNAQKQQQIQRKISGGHTVSYSTGVESASTSARQRHLSTPMSRLLSVGDSPLSQSVGNRTSYLSEDFRERAFSDPRSSLQAARRAAAKKVCNFRVFHH